MRVTNRALTRNYLTQLNKAYSDYSDTNSRIASGNRYTAISEDVSDGSQYLKARTDKYKIDAQLSNITNYTSQVDSAEDAMTSVNSILTQVHSTLGVKAGNLTTGDVGYSTISTQVTSLRDQVVTLMNQQYSSKYVFGGTNVSAPFTWSGDSLCYNGIPVDDIQQDTDGSYYYMKDGTTKTEIPTDKKEYIDIGNGLTMTDNQVKKGTGMCVTYSGLDVFGCGTDDDGDPKNIVSMLTKLATAISNGDTDEITTYNDKLGQLQDEFLVNLTDIGVKSNALDEAQDRLQSLSDNYKTRESNLIGVDDAEESTNQTTNDYVLKAVLSMGSKVLPTSLMSYLS